MIDFQLNDEEFEGVAPAFQPKIYLVMRVSPKLGGTYSEIRRSVQGVKRLLSDWDFMGIDMKNVRVYPVEKEWIPVRKTKKKGD